MMEKYNVEFNRKKLEENAPENKPDFQKFLSSARPGFNGNFLFKLVALSAIVAVVVGSLFYLAADPATQKLTKNNFVNPPLPGADVPFSEYLLDPKRDTILNLMSGSEILIPREAFLDSKGLVVSTPVILRYREFRDFSDFFLSGIPMTYDSAGTRFHFESAGMFEIRAFSENQPLYANSNAQIKVAMASQAPHNQFNIYYLDTIKGSWLYVSKDTTQTINAVQPVVSVKQRLESTVIVEPLKSDYSQYVFEIDYDKKEFPELAAFNNVKFQVERTQEDFDPKWSNQMWEDVQLKETEEDMTFRITFSNRNESHSFKARAVLEGEDYNRAVKNYKKILAAYSKRDSSRLSKEKRKADSLYQSSEMANTNAMEIEKMKEVQFSGQQAVVRVFQISRFGIWNSDNPCALPTATQVIAIFTDQSNKPLNLSCIYLGEKKRKVMFSYYSQGFSEFRFDPGVDNIVAGVTLDNKLVIMESKAISKLKYKNKDTGDSLDVAKVYKSTNLKKDTVRFVMKPVAFPVTDPSKLRQVLGI